jgi:hypothetical protein
MFVSAMRFAVVQVIKSGMLSDFVKHLVFQRHITKKYNLLRENVFC